MNILKAQNSIITLEDGRGTGDCGRDIYLRWHSETEAQTQDLSAMFENARLFIYTWNSLLTWLSSTVRKNYHLTTQHIPTTVNYLKSSIVASRREELNMKSRGLDKHRLHV